MGPVKPRATILGNEFAGEVPAIGTSVTRFHVGDRVFGYNEGRFGGHAEYVVIPEDGSVASTTAEHHLRSGRAKHRGIAPTRRFQ